ncbi:hypothetical protein XFF6992_230042 [Xanthomonas citri pv. fuscans]|nr:hypothetical protein XFF6992_230042 [Xanthomonas citri pv. fuscans]SOO32205.1 hypothetical protein XFF6994_1790005 [Xanthomonas citri pv. fuscans]
MREGSVHRSVYRVLVERLHSLVHLRLQHALHLMQIWGLERGAVPVPDATRALDRGTTHALRPSKLPTSPAPLTAVRPPP